ncbi:hypothetical protein [Algoriphagus limi]|uniref:Periplasmic copper-binding protein NosD beta helix domain-containing protein n=1 Tax=Algoriphagus limi TaxID=2975273 RepID=A0ABT2G5X2_9BACT|nr:hypothetical protein [Algoriphagus limi]MCS5490178.1 hypothetical protein [Algoriphagus limi]
MDNSQAFPAQKNSWWLLLLFTLFFSFQDIDFAQRTYIVNSVEDLEDVDLSDKICADLKGNCTLRAALQNANASKLRDKVIFDLKDIRSKRIVLQSYLPAILYPVEIYGTVNESKIDLEKGIVIDGANIEFDLERHRNIPEAQTGFLLREKSSGSVINGLIFQSFRNMAIKVESDHSVIQNNIFGSLEDNPKKGNGAGVSLWGNENLIGGDLEKEANYFLGNYTGVSCITGNSNKVNGNFFGVLPDRNEKKGNIIAVYFGFPSENNFVFRNLISGNTIGLEVQGVGNTILQNKIGTDYSGTKVNGNLVGILIDSSSSRISIGDENLGNLISGNEVGIMVDSKNKSVSNLNAVRDRFSDIKIKGNLIGTDISGEFSLGNKNGIVLRNSGGTIIGGLHPAESNLISGNFQNGLILMDSFENLIFGNKIGTDISGKNAIPNSFGIRINKEVRQGYSSNNSICNNFISGNLEAGVYIGEGTKQLNLISNKIGWSGDQSYYKTNQKVGVFNLSLQENNCFGGESSQTKNIISSHEIGFLSDSFQYFDESLENKNLFQENRKNLLGTNDFDYLGYLSNIIIPNYFKKVEQISLSFRIARFPFDSASIVQLKKEISRLPD